MSHARKSTERSSPRGKPVQTRSKETVRRVLVATRTILIEEGVQSLTTNRIAEISGVTVGSIYQYYPNKEAILAELYTSHLRAHLRLYEEHAKQLEHVADATEYYIESMLKFFRYPDRSVHRLHAELNLARASTPSLSQILFAHEEQMIELILRVGIAPREQNTKRFDFERLRFMFRFSFRIALMASDAIARGRDDYIPYLEKAMRASVHRFFAAA